MSDPLDSTKLDPCGCCAGEPEPTAHSNPPGQPELRYRIGTHPTFLEWMKARIHRWQVPDGDPAEDDRPLEGLTTRSADDPALALMDAWAVVGDVLTFYQERIANEGFLGTATERRSVLALARAIGYELDPGVAAATWVAFTVDEAEGAPTEADVPAGTQIQSLPTSRDELPQTFETSTGFTARVEWNALEPKKTEHHVIENRVTSLYLKGVGLQLEAGDALLIVGDERKNEPGNERWDVRSLQTVEEFLKDGYTRVDWQRGLGSPYTDPAADATAEVYVFRKRLALFGHNAPDWRVMPRDVRQMYCGKDDNNGNSGQGTNEDPCIDKSKEWPDFDLDTAAPRLHIDGDHPEVVAPTWIVLTDEDETELYRVQTAVPTSQTNFAVSGKTTRVTLDTSENLRRFSRRTAVVLAVPEKLERAEKPLETRVGGQSIELENSVAGLRKGQPLIVTGKLDEADEEPVSEVVFVDPPVQVETYTTLPLKDPLAHEYVRSTVEIHANVVPVTHGETVAGEVLGSGDGAQRNQRFTLKKPPLTHVGAETARGSKSTLTVRVDGVQWTAASSLYGLGPDSRSYIVRIDDDAKPRVIFGDGERGARLPTGPENVTATYRSGIGSGGEVDAGALSLLKTRPPGVREVTNPLPATGAADPEKLADARTNAPLTVLTLDRIVSLRDYEDFARAFTGIGKAQALTIWDGTSEKVHLTVADDDGDPVVSPLYDRLLASIEESRDPLREMILAPFDPIFFALDATVKIDPAYLWEDVKADVDEALRDAFRFERRAFGQPVTAAEVLEVIHSVEPVVMVDLDRLYESSGSGASLSGNPFHRVLDARVARWDETAGEILPAELLLLDPLGIDLTEARS